MKKKYITFVLLLLTGFICNGAYADQMPAEANLTVEGKALIQKNDLARAREAAVKNALETAVLQTAQQILADKFSDEKFQAVKSILISRADRYVKNYRIVSEGNHQEEYTATVEMLIVRTAVREDLVQLGVLVDLEKPKGQSVSVHLLGTRKYADFIRLKSFLVSQKKIVRSVYPCTLEARKAACELVIVGNVNDLVAELQKEGRYEVEAQLQNPDAVAINLRMREYKQ